MQLSNLTLPLDLPAAPAAAPAILPLVPGPAPSPEGASEAFGDLLVSAETATAPAGPAACAPAASCNTVLGDDALATDVLPGEPLSVSSSPRRPQVSPEQEQAAAEAAAAWLGLLGLAPASTPPAPFSPEALVTAAPLGTEEAPAAETPAASDVVTSAPTTATNLPLTPPPAAPASGAAASPIATTVVGPQTATEPTAAGTFVPPNPPGSPSRATAAKTTSGKPAAPTESFEPVAATIPAAVPDPLPAADAQALAVATNSAQPPAAAAVAATPLPDDQRVRLRPALPQNPGFTSRETGDVTSVVDAPAQASTLERIDAAPPLSTFAADDAPVSDLRALPPTPRAAVAPAPATPAPATDELPASEVLEAISVETGPASPEPLRRGKAAPASGNANTPAGLRVSSASPMSTAQPVAKFAAPRAAGDERAEIAAKPAEKNLLTAKQQIVADTSETLGINVAKPESLMPAPAFSAHPLLSEVVRATAPAATADFNAFSSGNPSPETEVAQAARRSVESAIEVARHFATGDKRAVTLQFSVSGVDLGVRVELRGDAVHTIFRTDSPELRAALAQQWQTVTGTPGADRASRLAEPVFTSNQSSSQSGADSGTADHRESPARHQQLLADAGFAPRVMTRSKSPLVAPPTAARATTVSAPGRLHTFA